MKSFGPKSHLLAKAELGQPSWSRSLLLTFYYHSGKWIGLAFSSMRKFMGNGPVDLAEERLNGFPFCNKNVTSGCRESGMKSLLHVAE